jgi:glutaredoxin
MEILLLTREDCAFCHDAEDILGRLGSEYRFALRTIDLDTPEGEALGQRGGILFPPGIFIDSEPFSYGRPSERKLRRELDRHLRLAPSS